MDVLLRARGEPDFGARLRERDRAGTSDAAAGAGDERDAVVEAKAIVDVQFGPRIDLSARNETFPESPTLVPPLGLPFRVSGRMSAFVDCREDRPSFYWDFT